MIRVYDILVSSEISKESISFGKRKEEEKFSIIYGTTLEKALNELEKEGWKIISIIPASSGELEEIDPTILEEQKDIRTFHHVIVQRDTNKTSNS